MSESTTLYLHIGQHKTGTSTIQNFFWMNRERLAAKGVLYPEIGLSGPTHAHFALSIPGKRDEMLATIFKNAASDRDGTYRAYNGESSDALFAQLGELIAETDCHTVFLSSECFMEWIEPSSIKNLIDRYCGCEVKVLLFLRRQDQWIQSVFNQVVKDPGLRYGGRLEALPQVDMLNYRHTVQGWSRAFGKENMTVLPYQEANRYDRGVLGLLADIIGLKEVGDYQAPPFAERNISLKRWQVDVLHELNRRDVSCDYFKCVLDAFSRQNELGTGGDGSTNCIGFNQGKALQRRYRRGNRAIAKVFLGKNRLFNDLVRSEYSDSGTIDSSVISELLVRLNGMNN